MAENDLYFLIVATGYISAYYFVLPLRKFFDATICGNLLVFIASVSLILNMIEVVSTNAKGFVQFALPSMIACVVVFGAIGTIHRALTKDLPENSSPEEDEDHPEDD